MTLRKVALEIAGIFFVIVAMVTIHSTWTHPPEAPPLPPTMTFTADINNGIADGRIVKGGRFIDQPIAQNSTADTPLTKNDSLTKNNSNLLMLKSNTASFLNVWTGGRSLMFPCHVDDWRACSQNPLVSELLILQGEEDAWKNYRLCWDDEKHCARLLDVLPKHPIAGQNADNSVNWPARPDGSCTAADQRFYEALVPK